MAVTWLARLALRAPVPVFVAAGRGGDRLLDGLALSAGVRLVSTPRHASLLLVAGEVPDAQRGSLLALHDQMCHPRATVWWKAEEPFDEELPPKLRAIRVKGAAAAEAEAALQKAARELLEGGRESEADFQPDRPPAPWRGQGDHGQGGEGMMGGVPYGRPMAMVDEDIRDGLQLDVLSFTAGPFFPALPAGLSARVTLQGDLVQQWRVLSPPHPRSLDQSFQDALSVAVPVAALETARARAHLRRLAVMLELNGLGAMARKVRSFSAGLRDYQALRHDRAAMEALALEKSLRRSGFLRTGADLGVLEAGEARSLGGFAARAAGVEDDARLASPVYERLGFQVLCQREGDLRARRRQLMREICQALGLAHKAAGLKAAPAPRVESPLGPLSEDHGPLDKSALLESLLPGLEWSEALAVTASLPLEAAEFHQRDHGPPAPEKEA